MTAILALAHAFKTNSSFEPFGLYALTFLIDIHLIDTLL